MQTTPETARATARTLVLMRHSKAEQYAASDAERELAPRGRGDAAEVGRWLAGHGLVCDHALVSAAARAVQTWESVADGAGWSLEPDVDPSLYQAGPETTLDVIRSAPDDATCVVVVGHNPTIATLAQLLDDGEGDDDAMAEMNQGYPTSAITVFRWEGPWADLELGSATVTAFFVGRGD